MTVASNPEVISLFATPVIAEPWPEAAQYNEALKQAMLARQATSESVSKSNMLGWQSDLMMRDWGGEAARRLSDHVVRRCDAMTHDLGQRGGRRFRWSPEMWANISPPNASNQTHAHPGSYWSAVYYVDDGFGGSADRALGGELTFLDPRFPMVRMRAPDLRYRRPNGSKDHHEVWMRPRTGLIVIFPSWLQHAVRPYLGTGTRMSIAINLTIRLLQGGLDG